MLGLGQTCGSITEVGFHNQGSIKFDGTNDYVDIDNIAATLATAFADGEGGNTDLAFSISMWVTIETMSSTGVAFNLRVGTSGDNHLNLQWHGSNNLLRFTSKINEVAETADDDGSGSYTASGAAENDGNWYHVVGTVADGGACELWINGTKRDSQNVANTLQGTVNTCNIATNTSEANFWNGNINDVSVWTRVLTDAEILAMYRDSDMNLLYSPSVASTGLVGYYRFEEKTGTVAINDADTSKNGTLTNSPTYSTETP